MLDGLEVDIDGRTAAVIAAGMKAVALADGVSHPREMALIEQFCESLPEDADPSGVVLEDDRERELFVRFLVMVALIDGDLNPAEWETIDDLAKAHGVGHEKVVEVAQAVRREMFAMFSGVKAFREGALGEAKRLGLDDDEASAILDA